jgi:hypothetical protein
MMRRSSFIATVYEPHIKQTAADIAETSKAALTLFTSLVNRL